MNLNGDEKGIQQLFREMSRDDECRAPEFAGVIQAASSRTAGSRDGTRSSAFAWAVAVLFIAVVIATVIVVRNPKPKAPAGLRDEVAVSPRPMEDAASNASPNPTLNRPVTTASGTIRKRVPRRRTSDELAVRMKSLSAWRSPTASLLNAPGEEILKSLPRLGESFQSIKSFSPEQFN